jgi:hypothetical protein
MEQIRGQNFAIFLPLLRGQFFIPHTSCVERFSEKEKESLFSVQGFETETSNFALNGCPRVSKNQKNSARSNKKSRLIPSTL